MIDKLRRRKRGFNLIELLIVIAIIAILAAILFPIFVTARQKAWQVQCISNLRQIGIATDLYMQESTGRYPPWIYDYDATNGRWRSWYDAAQKYSKCRLLTRCPAYRNVKITNETLSTYWKNVYIDRWSGITEVPPARDTEIIYPRTTCYLMDGPPNPGEWTWWAPPFTRSPTDPQIKADADLIHSGRGNVLFCDGHVVALRHESWKTTKLGTCDSNILIKVGNLYGGLTVPTVGSEWEFWGCKNDGSHPWFRPD